jgi:hypothetical protein
LFSPSVAEVGYLPLLLIPPVPEKPYQQASVRIIQCKEVSTTVNKHFGNPFIVAFQDHIW